MLSKRKATPAICVKMRYLSITYSNIFEAAIAADVFIFVPLDDGFDGSLKYFT